MDTLLKLALRELGDSTDGGLISKRISFVAIGTQVSAPVQANIEAIQLMNPDWAITVYDEPAIEAFISVEYGPHMLAVYHRINAKYAAARADFFRYLCIYRQGGLYLDLKSSTTKPLNSWLRIDDQYVLAHWDNGPGGMHDGWAQHPELRHTNGGELVQWFVLSRPGHPFLRAVCEQVIRNICACGPIPPRLGRHGVVSITGPIPYTLAIDRIRSQHPHRMISLAASNCGLTYTIFGQWAQHYKLSDVHYSELLEPVVELSRWQQPVFRVARSVKWRLERLQNSLKSAQTK